MDTQYDQVASERVAQTIASKKIYDQLYPPPDQPDYEDSDSKQTKRYLWTLYLAAVVFSAVHTIPGLLERVPDMMIFAPLNLKHIAGAAAFVMFEVGLMTIPYILFRYLTESAEAGKEARIFMRKSLRATVGLVVAVLVMLNIYTTLKTDTNISTQDNVVLASYSPVNDTGILENGMWAIVAISPVFIAVVSGMGLALLKSHQQNKEQGLRIGYSKQLKEHEKEFRHWDAIQQRHNKGAYSNLSSGMSTGQVDGQVMSSGMNGRSTGKTYSKRVNARSIVVAHLAVNPQDIDVNVRDLAEYLGVSKSTVSNVQIEYRKRSTEQGIEV